MPSSSAPAFTMNRIAQRPAAQLTFVFLASFAAYVSTLSRYFVSEDFTLLGFLSQRGLWENARTHFTSPLLDIAFVPFYRPLSTVGLDLEWRLWGTWPVGYLVTHFLLHLGNTAVLYSIVRRLKRSGEIGSGKVGSGDPTALAAALLFALYPLHPNTVVFIGSFANLFSATAGFASFWLFLRGRDGEGRSGGPRWRWTAASWLCFGVALGCYEAAAVLPALFLAADVLVHRGRIGRTLILRHLPYFVLLGGYLGLRRTVLGYAVSSSPMRAFEVPGFDWARFFYPIYEPAMPNFLHTTGWIVVASGTLWSVVRWLSPDRDRSALGRLWLLAVFWVVVAQLPYRELDVVPGNGRFWYISSAALGLLLAAAVGFLVPRRWRGVCTVAVALLVGAVYFRLLLSYNAVHVEAARTTRAIQEQLVEVSVASASTGRQRIFVTGYPTYLRDGGGSSIAQVYHWGLGDATRPPFTEHDLGVYPLPPLPAERLAPLLERKDLGPVLRWTGSELEELRRVSGPAQRITVRSPEDGEVSDDFRVVFESPLAATYQLVVLARGNPLPRVVSPSRAPDGVLEAQLPPLFLRSMLGLYRDEIFWWIEALDTERRLVAVSDLRTIGSHAGEGRRESRAGRSASRRGRVTFL